MVEWEMPVVKAAHAEAMRTGVTMAQALDTMMSDGRVAVEFVERPGIKNVEGVRFRVRGDDELSSDSVESRTPEERPVRTSKRVRRRKQQ